jgi:LacI family repressor for deo operon, udp, cdd, tsx, nupC, and nupG
MAQRPTIYDVARVAGVAPSTVSRAFSRPGRVNSDTAQHIREVAEELGYRVNPIARALSTQLTRMIALVVSDITNPFYFEIIRGAEEAAAAAGYTMILSDTRESDVLERQALERAMPAVEGIVLASSRMSDSGIRMTAKQKPLIVLNRAITDVPSVVTDNARGARRALEHLAELGHEAVTYVAGPDASYADGQRWRALLEACHELDLQVRRVGPNPPTVGAGARAVGQLNLSTTSAVIAYNDQLAIGLMRGLDSARVRVPRDISVIGFDNVLLAELVTPGLTTVAAPLKLMGATAVQHLMVSMGGARADRREQAIVLPTTLVVRASTAQRTRTRSR